jgi:hypothetical protein
VVAYTTLAGQRLPELVAGIGSTGVLLTTVALVKPWPSLLAWGLAFVAGGYAVLLVLRSGTVDSRAPFVAAALFVAAELAFWSVEACAARPERRVLIRRLLLLAVSAFAAALLGGLLLLAAAGTSGGIGLESLGVAAAVVTLAIVALLASRSA